MSSLICNKYYNLDDDAVVSYSLFVLLRPGGYGPLCILQELKRGTGWEWLHNTLTEYYYLKYGEEWKTTELSENWNSCGKVNTWWASCTWTIPQGINLKFYMLVLSEQNPYFLFCVSYAFTFLTEISILQPMWKSHSRNQYFLWFQLFNNWIPYCHHAG